jgi:hypothetical protein
MVRFFNWSLPFSYSVNLCMHLSCLQYVPMPFNCIYTDMITLTLFGRESVQVLMLFTKSVTSLHLFSPFGLNILLSRHPHSAFTQ